MGDQLLVCGRHVDDREQRGTIVAVLGSRGDPPYRVRFDDGHETVLFPGPDAVITPSPSVSGSDDR